MGKQQWKKRVRKISREGKLIGKYQKLDMKPPDWGGLKGGAPSKRSQGGNGDGRHCHGDAKEKRSLEKKA